jgi:hypothetical protein
MLQYIRRSSDTFHFRNRLMYGGGIKSGVHIWNSPTCGGRSVGIVRLRTKTTECFCLFVHIRDNVVDRTYPVQIFTTLQQGQIEPFFKIRKKYVQRNNCSLRSIFFKYAEN